MPDSPAKRSEPKPPDAHEVLVLLTAPGSGTPVGPSDLSAEALIRSLTWYGYAGHIACTAEEAREMLGSYPIGAAILDLQVAPAELYAVYDLLHISDRPMPCLLLGSSSVQAASTQPAALDRLDEFVRIDSNSTAEYVLMYLRAALLRAYPDLQHLADSRVERKAEAPVETSTDNSPSTKTNNELIAVFAAKGGGGKTTIACNLAVALTVERKRKVALVDADFYFGDVDINLSLASGTDRRRRSLHTLVAANDLGREGRNDDYQHILADFDMRTLDEVLEHHKSGLRVLPAPPRPEMAERIPPAVLRHAIRLCSEEYEYTIVDMCSSYAESDMQLLDMATRIVVVLKPEMSSIRNTTVFMDYARQFGWKRKLVMVLNRADSNRYTKISQVAVEQHLGCPVIPIPSSGLVPQAASEGRSLIEVFPTSKVADALRVLLDTIAGPSDDAQATKTGFAKNILGRLGPKRVADVTSQTA